MIQSGFGEGTRGAMPLLSPGHQSPLRSGFKALCHPSHPGFLHALEKNRPFMYKGHQQFSPVPGGPVKFLASMCPGQGTISLPRSTSIRDRTASCSSQDCVRPGWCVRRSAVGECVFCGTEVLKLLIWLCPYMPSINISVQLTTSTRSGL